MTLIPAIKNIKENMVFSNLKHKREIQKSKYQLGDFIRTADIKKVFSHANNKKRSYKLYKLPEVIHDTTPSYRISFLPERYNEHLLRLTKQILTQNNQVMKKLNLIQGYENS